MKGSHWNYDPSGLENPVDELTWWEMLDGEVTWTAPRKFLATVPILLFLFAGHAAGWPRSFYVLHLPAALLIVFAKFPAFHRVSVV